jgi:hypothetical protein
VTTEIIDWKSSPSRPLDRAAGVGAINVRAATGGTGHDVATRVLE